MKFPACTALATFVNVVSSDGHHHHRQFPAPLLLLLFLLLLLLLLLLLHPFFFFIFLYFFFFTTYSWLILYFVTRKQRVNAPQRTLRLNYRFKTFDLTGRQKPRLIKTVLKAYKKQNSRKNRRPSQVLNEYYPDSLPSI